MARLGREDTSFYPFEQTVARDQHAANENMAGEREIRDVNARAGASQS
jgi:hypothetical protein